MFSRYILWQIYSNLFNLDSGVFNLVFDLHRPNQRYFFFTYRPTNFHVITTITAIVKIETLSVRSLSQRSLRPLNGNFHMSAIISKLIFFFQRSYRRHGNQRKGTFIFGDDLLFIIFRPISL